MTIEYDFTTKNEKAMRFVTRECYHCDGDSVIAMTMSQYENYVNRTQYIQDIFPHISKEEREVLISGIHPKCWNEIWERTGCN